MFFRKRRGNGYKLPPVLAAPLEEDTDFGSVLEAQRPLRETLSGPEESEARMRSA